MKKFLITFFWQGLTRQETVQAVDFRKACDTLKGCKPGAVINRVQSVA